MLRFLAIDDVNALQILLGTVEQTPADGNLLTFVFSATSTCRRWSGKSGVCSR